MKKTGRPKKIIEYGTVERLASIMCTQEEIAEFLEISVRTLQRDKEFCRIYKKGLETGKMSLRRKQFKLADRNPAMAIFLGKNYLNQKDKQDISLEEFPKTVILIEGKKKKEQLEEEEEERRIVIDVGEPDLEEEQ
jgi:hypothetical protein